jgi:hypothetical protein
MKEAQTFIKKVVEFYKKAFPLEYQAVVRQIKIIRNAQKNEFASIKRKDAAMERKLIEIPETLFNIFIIKLPQSFMEYYYSKPGTRWFAKEFPEFRVADRI